MPFRNISVIRAEKILPMFVRAILSSFRKTDNRANYKAHLNPTKAHQTLFRSVPGREGEGTQEQEGGKRKREWDAVIFF
jgi:hypothetical protein